MEEIISNKNRKKLKRAKTPTEKNKLNLKYEIISEYIKLNKLSFQNLENKNFSLAKSNFDRCMTLAQEIDEFKYIEALTNYSVSLYFNNEISASYKNLKIARDLSANLYEKTKEINQIYFIYLRVLSNLCLISLNINKIEKSVSTFNKIISLIKDPKEKNIRIQYFMLRELIYIFYRIDSPNQFHDINETSLKSINNTIHLNEKGLYYLYESLRNNDFNLWIDYLNKELQNNNKDNTDYIWILINRIIALHYQNSEKNENLENSINNLINYIKEYYDDNDTVNKDDINNIIMNFKKKFELAIEYYKKITNLENELQLEIMETKQKIIKGKENKVLIKLLLKNAIKSIEETTDDKKSNETKKQIECALFLIEKNQINWELLSVLNINPDIIKSIKYLFYNISKIKYISVLRQYFHKFKKITLGEILSKDRLKKKYKKSKDYLKKQLISLEDGSILTKFNYNSKGTNDHFYRISLIEKEYYLCIHKKVSEKQPYKVYKLEELYDITIGASSDNLKDKIDADFFNEYKPWCILSLYFPKRTIDLYFDFEEEINMWFEAIYYYNKYVAKNNKYRSLNYFFFNKVKLKMLYDLKSFKNNLEIIEKLKYYSAENELEYQSISFNKTLILYNKVKEKINKKDKLK